MSKLDELKLAYEEACKEVDKELELYKIRKKEETVQFQKLNQSSGSPPHVQMSISHTEAIRKRLVAALDLSDYVSGRTRE